MKSKTVLRIISGLLCSVTAISLFSACRESTDPADTTAAQVISENVPVNTDPVETGPQLGVPEFFNFDTVIRIHYRGGDDEKEIRSEDETGEMLPDAIFTRNARTENRLGIKFEFDPYGTTTTGYLQANVTSAITSGESDIDIIAWSQYALLSQSTKGYFYNLYNTKYIDFEKPWWNQKYMNTLDIGDSKRYFAMGDISLSSMRVCSAVFFNKTLYDSYNKGGDLYAEVLDKKWTLDRMFEICDGCYVDVNGNGVIDTGTDITGCVKGSSASSEMFTYPCGFTLIERDGEGNPSLVTNIERQDAIITKLQHLFYDCRGFDPNGNDTDLFNNSVVSNIFAGGNMMFMASWIKNAEKLTDMDDYGIIPQPMFDENQADYISLIQDTATVFAIPSCNQQPDAASAAIESLCYENYLTVFPTYYDIILKSRYSTDSVSAQMIDKIHDTAITDFAYAYNYAISEIGTIMRPVLANKSMKLSPQFKGKSKAGAKGLEDLLAEFNG